MKLSEMIEESQTLLIEGEPKDNEWVSIDRNARARKVYLERLDELRNAIDDVVKKTK